jgi:hypothetical protein
VAVAVIYPQYQAAKSQAAKNTPKVATDAEINERIADYNEALDWLTGFLVVANLALWGATWRGSIRQSRDMEASIAVAKTSAEAAKKSADAIEVLERAAIAVHFGTIIGVGEGKRGISIGLMNIGRTAGTTKDILVKFDYRESLPQIPDYTGPDITVVPLNTVLNPNHERPWYPSRPFAFNLDSEPFCYGYVRFEDIFKKKWTYRFSVRIYPARQGEDRCPSEGPNAYHEDIEGWDI